MKIVTLKEKSVCILNIIVDVIKAYEGGYVNDPNDSGGETNFGISKKQYPNLDIKNLTIQQAAEIYKKDYWSPACDTLLKFMSYGDDFQCASRFFAFGINRGTETATKVLQTTLNLLQSQDKQISVDGIWGPRSERSLCLLTANGMSRIHSLLLYHTLLNEMILSYYSLCKTKPKLRVYLTGWLKRIFE